MTEPGTSTSHDQNLITAARDSVHREVIRLARDSGASLVTRPMYSSASEPTVRDAEPLAGARAAQALEHAAQRAARDYIRQAREAGYDWDQIGRTLGLHPGRDADQEGAGPADAAYTYAAGHPDTDAPWRPRSFSWTCRSCDQNISDHGVVQGPADDEIGHAEDCPRRAAAVADWDAEAAEWEAGQ